MNVLLIGPANAGKGSLNIELRKEFPYKYLSSGDLLREKAKDGTALGSLIKNCIHFGRLVPAELVSPACVEIIKKSRFNTMLDGYPRTVLQAKHLLENFSTNSFVAVVLELPEEECINRSVLRRVCKYCNAPQTLNQDGRCEVCKEENAQERRTDDDRIEERLASYKEETLPMVEYLLEKGIKVIFVDVSTGLKPALPNIVKQLRRYIG